VVLKPKPRRLICVDNTKNWTKSRYYSAASAYQYLPSQKTCVTLRGRFSRNAMIAIKYNLPTSRRSRPSSRRKNRLPKSGVFRLFGGSLTRGGPGIARQRAFTSSPALFPITAMDLREAMEHNYQHLTTMGFPQAGDGR